LIRNLFRFLVLLLVIAVVRFAIGAIRNALAGKTDMASRPSSPAAGELLQDPVCGAFVPASAAVTKKVDGTLIHFCSAACRDKYRAA
jgi:uncharacterized protein